MANYQNPPSSIWSGTPKSASSSNAVTGRLSGVSFIRSHLGGSLDEVNERISFRIGRQHNQKYKPSGPALAEEIFRTDWCDKASEASECDDYDSASFETHEFGWVHQPSLDLETNLELQERLQRQIRKFEDGYRAMCLAAVRWHQLMEDVHEDPQIRKMFLDLQMMRKLSGLEFE